MSMGPGKKGDHLCGSFPVVVVVVVSQSGA